MSVLFLALALATHGVHAANVGSETMVAGASCLTTPGKCGGGGDSNALSPISCSALNCNGATAIEGTSVATGVLPVRGDPATLPAMKGHEDPPDPYPPRLALLS